MLKIMKMINQEIKLDIKKGFKLKYGTTNKKFPQIFYLNGRTWVIPPTGINAKEAVEDIRIKLRGKIKNLLLQDTNLDKKFILDFDLRPESIIPNKRKFVSFDIFLKQIDVKPLLSIKDDISDKLLQLSENIENTFEEYGIEIESK